MTAVTGLFARVATLIKDGRTDGLWADHLGIDLTDGRHGCGGENVGLHIQCRIYLHVSSLGWKVEDSGY